MITIEAPTGVTSITLAITQFVFIRDEILECSPFPRGAVAETIRKQQRNGAHRPAVSTWLSGYPQQESRDIARFKPSPDPRIGYPPVFIPDTGKSLRIHLKAELFFH